MIIKETLESIKNGARYRIDFKEKELILNNKKVIDKGKYEGELGVEKLSTENFLEKIEGLYALYKYSIPSERSEARRRNYFVALPESELDKESLLYGENRETARAELELTVLCQIILGFQWEDSMGKWFYQGKDKDLILLKEWFES